jgi:hypothetical protein
MKNFLTTVFLIIFCTTLCEIAGLKPAISQSHFTRVKSHLVFKKEFSGIVKVIDGDSIKKSPALPVDIVKSGCPEANISTKKG